MKLSKKLDKLRTLLNTIHAIQSDDSITCDFCLRPVSDWEALGLTAEDRQEICHALGCPGF